MPAEKGIFLDVLPRFDMAAMGAILGRVEGLFKKTGASIGQTFGKEAQENLLRIEATARKAASGTSDAFLRMERATHAAEVAQLRYNEVMTDSAAKASELTAAQRNLEVAQTRLNEVQGSGTVSAVKLAQAQSDLNVAQARYAELADKDGVSAARLAKALDAVGIAQLKLSEVQESGTVAASALAKATADVEVAEMRLAEVQTASTASASAKARAEYALADAKVAVTNRTRDYNEAQRVEAQATDKATGAKAAMAATASNAGRVLNTFGLVLTGGVAVGAVEATKAAGDFEEKLTRLVASAGETNSNIKTVSDGIMNIASQTGYSSKELADGMYLIEKAGFHGSEGVKVLTAAAQLARAENADLTEVNQGLTTSMHDFNIPFDQAATVASKLNTAVSLSKTNLQLFTGSLHNIEPVASIAHMKLEEVYAAVARITQSGTSPDQATQNLKNMVEHLTNITGPTRDAMGKMGLSADDLKTKLGDPNVGLAGVLKIMSDTIQQHMTPNQMVAVDAMYKSVDAGNALTAMYDHLSPSAKNLVDQLKSGAIGWDQFHKEARKSTDMDQATLAQWNTLNNKVEGFSTNLRKGQSDLESVSQIWKELTGTDAGFQMAAQLAGTPKALEDFQKATKDIAGTTTEANDAVKGFGETQETFNAKMRDAKAAFGGVVIELGTAFLPVAKEAAQVMHDFGDYLKEHPGIAKAVMDGLLGIAGGFVAIKTAMFAKTAWTELFGPGLRLIREQAIPQVKLLATEFQGVASAADVTAAQVATDAAEEATAQKGVVTAAGEASTALAGAGAAAKEGAAGVKAAADEEVAAVGSVGQAAKVVDGELIGMGAAAKEGAVAAEGALNGFFSRNAGRLKMLGGLGGMLASQALPDDQDPTGGVLNTAAGLSWFAGPEVGAPVTAAVAAIDKTHDYMQHPEKLETQPNPVQNANAPDLSGQRPDAPVGPSVRDLLGQQGMSIGPNGQILGPDGKPLPGHAHGGIAGSRGMILPGFSRKDNLLGHVPGHGVFGLAGGEGIINAESTRRIGAKGIAALNGFSTGGIAPGGSGGGDGYSNLMAVAQSMVGAPYSEFDCSGAASELVNAATGGSGRMTTRNAAEFLQSRGFMPGEGPQGSLRIGWYNHGPNPQDGHMAVTLPDGTHAESGGSHGSFVLGPGAAGAENSEFDHHAYLPIQALYGDGVSPGGGGGGGRGGIGGLFGGGGGRSGGGSRGYGKASSGGAEGVGMENPFDSIGSGGFTLANIAKMLTMFVANLALGNPVGQIAAAKAGYAGSAGGDQAALSPASPAYADVVGNSTAALGTLNDEQFKSLDYQIQTERAARRTAAAQEHLREETAKHGEGSAQALRAQNALISAQEAQGNLANRQDQAAGRADRKLDADLASHPKSAKAQANLQVRIAKDRSAAAAANSAPGANGNGGSDANDHWGGTGGDGFDRGNAGWGDDYAGGGGEALPVHRLPGIANFGGAGLPPAAQGGLGTLGGSLPGGSQAGAQSSQPQGGSGKGAGVTGGGILGGAAAAAGSMVPGGGAAASIGMQEAGRAVGALGQYAATAVNGLFETFSISGGGGGKGGPGNNWITKIANGVAGAHPSTPNAAGQTAPPLDPKDSSGQGQGGNTVNGGGGQGQGDGRNGPLVHIENQHVNNGDGQQAGADIARQMMTVPGF